MKLFIVVQQLTVINVLYSLEVLQLEAPPYVRLGDSFTMNCYFDLEGEKLYSIKWFRDTYEIFSYIATLSDSGVTSVAKSVPGVHVQSSRVLPDSLSSLVLVNTTHLSTGLYQCEVNGDSPSFLSQTDTKKITVVECPTSPPQISGLKADLSPGDFLSLNCTVHNSSADVILQWKINHQVVEDFDFLRKYPNRFTGRLYPTILGLQFWVKKHHFREGKLVVSCEANIPVIYNASTVSYVVGRYTEPLQYLETKSSGSALWASTLLIILLVL